LDTLTHIAIGACIGEVVLHKQLGKKALLWGILAQSIPDIDFIAVLWTSTSENLLAHRGFTHSILFALIISLAMSLAADHWHRPHNIRFTKFILFFTAQVFIHNTIDAFNNYGVGWFEPFSHERISFNTIFVADPFFSIAPGLAAVALFILKNSNHRHRKYWVRGGLMIPVIYLGYALFNKTTIDKDVRTAFAEQKISYTDYFTTPTPLNNWLWYVVAKDNTGYHIGFRSVFDTKPGIDFTFFPRNDSLLKPVLDHEDAQHLLRFSRGFYILEKWNDSLVFNDLRFGQIAGWQNPKGKFAFHYFLQHPDGNKLVVQRGRFKGWDRQTVNSLLNRIKGN
jgi:inner membrane protein